MCGLRRYCATLARQEPIDAARRSRLDHHRPLEANEAVADLAVVMPRHALPGCKAQHLDAQIGALGDELAASNLVITAVAPLHRSFPSSVPRADFVARSHNFDPLPVSMTTSFRVSGRRAPSAGAAPLGRGGRTKR